MPPDVPRRRVLAAATAVSTLATTGCATSQTATPAPSASPPPTGPATALGPSTGPVRVADIPVGGGLILDTGDGIVLTQPKAGLVKAFTAVCTHQGCVVSQITDGLIVCPCHGSQFRIADGTVARGPAARPLPQIPVTLHDGVVTVHPPTRTGPSSPPAEQ